MKTATIELPGIIVSAIKAYEFTDKPLWRIGEGLDHVKIELTYKLPTDQPTVSVEQREKTVMSKPKRGKAKRRTEPAPSAGEWPRQPLPAEQPPSTPVKPTRTQSNRRCKTPLRELPPSPPLRQCPPPLTPTIIETPSTITLPSNRPANQPPPSPLVQPPPPPNNDDPSDEIDDLPEEPDYSDLPDIPQGYDAIIQPTYVTLGLDYDIAAIRSYNNTTYFQCYSKHYPGRQFKFYARYDAASNAIVVACPPCGPNCYTPEIAYKYFKNIFHSKASPVVNSNLSGFFKLRYAFLAADTTD